MKPSLLKLMDELNTEKPKRKLFLKLKNVIEVCEKAWQSNPENINVAYNLGRCYIELRDYNNLQRVMDRLRKEELKHVSLYVLDGHMYIKRGCLVEAYKCFLKAYSMIQENDPFLAYGIALLFEHIESYEIARKWYVHLLRYDIELFKYFEVIYRIGVGYKKENRFIDACEVFKTLLGLSKSQDFICDIKLQLAHIYERMNNSNKCIEILDEIKPIYKKKVLLYRMYAWAYFKRKDYEKVKELEDNKECADPYILYLVARAHLTDNNYQKAIMLLDTSIGLDQDMFMAYNTLGVIYYKTKQIEKGLFYLNKAVKIRPGFIEALDNVRMIEGVSRKYLPGLNVKEAFPDLARTRYLDSQVIFNECIYYATPMEKNTVQEMSTLRMETL